MKIFWINILILKNQILRKISSLEFEIKFPTIISAKVS